MVFRRVGIVYDPMKEESVTLASELEQQVNNHGVAAWQCSAWEMDGFKAKVEDSDLILSIGGDGIILRVVQAIVPLMTPICGINLGGLGFMTELKPEEAVDKLPVLLAGEGWIDERSMLAAEVSNIGQVFHGLNDIVLVRKAITKTIPIDTKIDSESFTIFQANGVIIATATGSTGYSLSAGGPILHPQAEEFILVPIMSHLGIASPLVLPPRTSVNMRISTNYEVLLSIDGQVNLPMSGDVSITARLSNCKTRFLRIHPHVFYGTLAKKLKRTSQVQNE